MLQLEGVVFLLGCLDFTYNCVANALVCVTHAVANVMVCVTHAVGEISLLIQPIDVMSNPRNI